MHTNVPATRVETEEAVWDAETPGTYHLTGERIIYLCPCGCGQNIRLPINHANERPSWAWDKQEPVTITPSIRRLDGCRWHGHLRAGVWEPCSDSGRKV
jgi:hypothetical protein